MVLIEQGVRVIETGGGQRLEANMPLTRVVGAVAEGLQMLRCETSPIRHDAGGHHIAGGLLGILSGKDATARGATAGCGVALGEAQTVRGEAVNIGRVDVTAIATGIGVTHVVGENDEEVWLWGRHRLLCGEGEKFTTVQGVHPFCEMHEPLDSWLMGIWGSRRLRSV